MKNWKLFFFAFYTVISPTTIFVAPIYFISFSIYLHFVIVNKCIRLAIFFSIFWNCFHSYCKCWVIGTILIRNPKSLFKHIKYLLLICCCLYYTALPIEKIVYFIKLVGWEQLARQGVPRWQVHKRVAGGSQRRGSVVSPVWFGADHDCGKSQPSGEEPSENAMRQPLGGV